MVVLPSPPMLQGNQTQQLQDVRRYLYRLVEQLNSSLNHLTAENFAGDARAFGQYARQHGAVLLVTGPVDLVTDGETTLGIANGTPLLGRLTGTGCMVGALAGTWHACGPSLAAAALGTAVLGIAGEEAAKDCPGLGTFHIRLLDALSNLTGEKVAEKVKMVGAVA